MGIRNRIDDAIVLWQSGRLEGAFLSALVAAAATSRKRFRNRRIGDREAFERFLELSHSVRLSVEYRGECHPIEHIFYKWFRCELVHEGGLPPDIRFMSEAKPRELAVRAGGAPEFVLKVSAGWCHHVVAAVIEAPENAGLFMSDSAVQHALHQAAARAIVNGRW